MAQRWLDRILAQYPFGYQQSRAELTLISSAVAVGVLTTMGAIIFVASLDLVQKLGNVIYAQAGAFGLLALMGARGKRPWRPRGDGSGGNACQPYSWPGGVGLGISRGDHQR